MCRLFMFSLGTTLLEPPSGLSIRTPSGLWVGRVQAQPWLRAEAATRIGLFFH